MKNPICPYCKSDDVVMECPSWKAGISSVKRWGWKIETFGYCVNCNREFATYADVNFHNSRKIKQEI